jgi:hypothetical protein
LILENALIDPFVSFRSREPGDTALHVVHGRSGDGGWSDSSFDPSFVWWRQPHRDTVIVWFGTGFGGIDYAFGGAGDGLRGVVGTHDDRAGAPSWRAPVTGRTVRCPPAPAPIGRLRLTIADRVPASTPLGMERLQLATEMEFDCGGRMINYEATVSPDTVAVLIRGTFQPHGRPCTPGPGSATTDLDLPGAPRRVLLLIKHEGETNRFVVTMTDSSLAVATERATTVVAEQRVRLRPRRNMFVITCGAQRAQALCDELGTWLTRQPGLSRVGDSAPDVAPYTGRPDEHSRLATFRYTSPTALQRVRECLVSVGEQIRASEGVYIRVVTSLGEELTVAGDDTGATRAPIPQSVTANPACGGMKLVPAQ